MWHYQKRPPNHDDSWDILPTKVAIKAVDGGDILQQAKQRFASQGKEVITIHRHWGGTQNIWGGDLAHNMAVARQFLNEHIDETFIRQYAEFVDIVLEWNEYIASSHTADETKQRTTWAEAVAKVWQEEYRYRKEWFGVTYDKAPLRNTRLGLCSTAVGNWIHHRFAEIAVQYDCVISYHAYMYWLNGVRAANCWADLSGVWVRMEQDWAARGIDVSQIDWMFGECGPHASVVDGWRSDKCIGHNIPAYVEAMRQFVRDVQQTDAYKQGRVLGFNIFTTGGGDQWDDFETAQPELNELAHMFAEEWQPGTEPPPPPEPDPEEHDNKLARVAFNRRYRIYEEDFPIHLVLEDVRRLYEAGERPTFGWSADDAGIGCGLGQRNVEMVGEGVGGRGFEESDVEEYAAWFNEHYPGAVAGFAKFASLTAGQWRLPVGHPSEFEAGIVLPTGWTISTKFAEAYELVRDSGEFHYHTGLDLNRNTPVFDADRNMPLFAPANGKVLYAGQPSEAWQDIVIIEHRLPTGAIVLTRTAHLFYTFVRKNQYVRIGDIIGTTGFNVTSAGRGPYHCHYDISKENNDTLRNNPADWPAADRSRVVNNYQDPFSFHEIWQV